MEAESRARPLSSHWLVPLPASQRVALDVGAEVTLRATLAALDEFQVELVPEGADDESSPEGADDDAGSPFELAEGRPSIPVV